LASILLWAGALSLAVSSEAGAGLPCDNANLFEVSSIPADSGATQLLSADLNGDSRSDLVVVRGSQGTFEVRPHVSGTEFAPGTMHSWGAPILRAIFTDLNADGRPDLAFTDEASSVVIFRGNADGTLEFVKAVALPYPGFDLVAANLNGAGASELVVSHPTAGRLTSLMWTSAPFNYQLVTSSLSFYVPDPSYLAIGKVNSDQYFDIVVSRGANAQVASCRGLGTLGAGSGGFAVTSTLLFGAPATALALADLDLDGKLDLLCGTPGRVAWEFGSGAGAFSGGSGISLAASSIRSFVVADLNRDAQLDILFARPGAHLVTQITGRGARTFELGPDYVVGVSPVSLAEVGMAGRGDHDYVVAARESAGLALLVSSCEVVMEPPSELPPLDPLVPPVPHPDPPPVAAVAPPPTPPDPGPDPPSPPWPLNGIVVCDAAGQQSGFTGADDFAHGAYFAWVDERSGESDIYVTRIGPDGQPVAGWTPNGTPVCTAAGAQGSVICFTDGPWGVWVLWLDQRDPGRAVYIQKLLPNGQIAPGWPSNGRRFCASPSLISFSAASDRRGGMQISWIEVPSAEKELYVHHLDPDGMPAPGWPECGVLGFREQIISDACSRGGRRLLYTSFSWPEGTRYTYENSNYCFGGYACHGCYSYWSTGIGVIVPGAGMASNLPEVEAVSPGGGPSLHDYCEYLSTHDDGAGGYYTFDGCYQMFRWGAFGNPSWMIDFSFAPDPLPDGASGLDVVRYTNSRIHVSKLLNDGTWSPNFGSDGVPVCEPPCGLQYHPARAVDGSGGAMIVWRDSRGTTGYPYVGNLYATWIRADGTRGPGWRPDGDPIATTPVDEEIALMVSNRRGSTIVGWRDQRDGDWDLYAYRLTATPPNVPAKEGAHVAPAIATRAGAAQLSFAGARPNPSSQGLRAEFTLSRAGDATLRVLDVSGRLAVMRELRGLGPGPHAVALEAGEVLPPGIYLLELAAEGQKLHRKLVVTR
jgi:hypothetical protein